MIQSIANWFMTSISLLTAMGVFMHDGRVDKAAMTAMDNPFSAKYLQDTTFVQKLSNFTHTDAHTHPDHSAAQSLLSGAFGYKSPSVPPRNREERKNRLQIPEDVGRHAFDDVHMPILA